MKFSWQSKYFIENNNLDFGFAKILYDYRLQARPSYVFSKIGYDAKLSRTFLYSQNNIFHINGK